MCARGKVARQCGKVARQCGKVVRQCGKVARQCVKVARQRGKVARQCGKRLSGRDKALSGCTTSISIAMKGSRNSARAFSTRERVTRRSVDGTAYSRVAMGFRKRRIGARDCS
jgi:hypothetical protein